MPVGVGCPSAKGCVFSAPLRTGLRPNSDADDHRCQIPPFFPWTQKLTEQSPVQSRKTVGPSSATIGMHAHSTRPSTSIPVRARNTGDSRRRGHGESRLAASTISRILGRSGRLPESFAGLHTACNTHAAATYASRVWGSTDRNLPEPGAAEGERAWAWQWQICTARNLARLPPFKLQLVCVLCRVCV
jgi:hypothetical protein